MIKFAVRGLLARKLRTILTALGVVLGVALVSGTYVLTDSISTAFNSIFEETYKNTDVAVTGKPAFSASDQGNGANSALSSARGAGSTLLARGLMPLPSPSTPRYRLRRRAPHMEARLRAS